MWSPLKSVFSPRATWSWNQQDVQRWEIVGEHEKVEILPDRFKLLMKWLLSNPDFLQRKRTFQQLHLLVAKVDRHIDIPGGTSGTSNEENMLSRLDGIILSLPYLCGSVRMYGHQYDFSFFIRSSKSIIAK